MPELFNINVNTLNNSHNCIFYKDKNLRFTASNNLNTKVLGYSNANSIIGKRNIDFMGKKTLALEIEKVDKYIIEREISVDRIVMASNRKGKVIIGNEIKYPVYDERKAVIGILGIIKPLSIKELQVKNKDIFIKYLSFQGYTARESECLHYLIQGYSYKVISSILNISQRTVETHVLNIKEKMGCNSRYEIINKIKNIDSSFLSSVND